MVERKSSLDFIPLPIRQSLQRLRCMLALLYEPLPEFTEKELA